MSGFMAGFCKFFIGIPIVLHLITQLHLGISLLNRLLLQQRFLLQPGVVHKTAVTVDLQR